MKIRILIVLLFSLIASCVAAESNAGSKIKVLVVTGGHEFKPEPFFKMFKDNPEITYVAASQEKAAEAYDRDDLFSYDVVVLYDSPTNITDAQKAKFLALFDKGIGVVIMHHAYLSYPMWPEYERIAGGKYVYTDEQIKEGLTSSDYKGNVDIPVTVVAKDHPVTAGLHDFVLKDELYLNMHMRSDVTPLLTTGDELLAWTRQEKRSRVVGMIIGHGSSAYENPNFLKLLAQSIRWTAQRSGTEQKQADASSQTQHPTEDFVPSHRADWMRAARWGVMTHFLAEWIEPEAHADVKAWNAFVDGFDTEALADQLKSVGAGYYIITIGQNSGYYDAPNATYDRIVGIQPSHCSKRDLISDLSESLSKRGIKLIVYLPAGAPGGDATARKALEWQNGPHRNREFEIKWEQVIRDWSLRWGKKVSGWWFDGVYWSNYMYRSAEPPNFASFAAAARAGNPDSVVAFNPGVIYRTISLTPEEDYTAGEVANPELVEIRRTFDGRADGDQIHMLSHIGQQWGKGPSRFSNEQIIRWTKDYISRGGVVTWDVPIQPNGHISQPFIDQLSALGKALAQK